MSLANRFVRSATWEGMATSDGICTGRLTETMAKLAEGGVGLIITGHAYVSREGQASPWQAGIHDDTTIHGLTQMADAVHQRGGRIAVQLAHAGGRAVAGLSSLNAMGPSVVYKEGTAICREMNQEDIDKVVRAFGFAAARAKRCGFDAIQIHAAHGYLLHQFLSPLSNHRTDAYGGSFENRTRLVREVVTAVREVWHESKPLFVRVSATDWMEPKGWPIEQTSELAKSLSHLGVDLIDCSSGGLVPNAKVPLAPGYQVPFAARIRLESGVATGAVGLITDAHQADTILHDGKADAVFIGREFLRDPQFALHAANELGVDVPWPRQYLRAKKS